MQQQQQQQYNNISYNIMQQQQTPEPEQMKPRIRILEQPKSNSLRFRYQCEGRGAGALQGGESLIEAIFSECVFIIVRPQLDSGPEDLPQDPDHGHPEEGGGGGELRHPRH